jgi:hypothetical protein
MKTKEKELSNDMKEAVIEFFEGSVDEEESGSEIAVRRISDAIQLIASNAWGLNVSTREVLGVISLLALCVKDIKGLRDIYINTCE